MSSLHMVCPECSGNLLVQTGTLPLGTAHDGDSYQVFCPPCGSEFPIGYIAEFKKVEPTGETSDSIEVQHTMSDGYGFVGRSTLGPSPNDQRSNPLNPKIPSHGAAVNNRSNQMNPNNPAYRSSRR